MQVRSAEFKAAAAQKLGDPQLYQALAGLRNRMVGGRAIAIQELDNFEEIREAAAQRARFRARAPGLFSRAVRAQRDWRAARRCTGPRPARTSTSSCSTSRAATTCARSSSPSRCWARKPASTTSSRPAASKCARPTWASTSSRRPARRRRTSSRRPIHRTKEQVADLFAARHNLPRKDDIGEMTREAREILRPHFLTADMGISGANFLVAETGTTMIVTNEGNGRMTTTLPRVHVAIAGIEKVLPTLEDVAFILRLLTRSATGQSISNYLSFTTGPKGAQDDGRARAIPHHHRRLRAHARARLGIARGAALHPLRRLHESLSGLPEHRRTSVRLGLSRARSARF